LDSFYSFSCKRSKCKYSRGSKSFKQSEKLKKIVIKGLELKKEGVLKGVKSISHVDNNK